MEDVTTSVIWLQFGDDVWYVHYSLPDVFEETYKIDAVYTLIGDTYLINISFATS